MLRAMRRRLLLLPVLAAGALALPSAAAAATSRADVRAFTTATLSFDLARGKAIGRAERRGDARRTAALTCSDTLRAAPAATHDELFALYGAYVGRGYFDEDEATFARWVQRLKAVRTSDLTLRRARNALAAHLRSARRTYTAAADFCGPVTTWAAAGWARAATPAVVTRVRARKATAGPNPLNAAARLMESRGGAGRQLAGSVMREGIDEGEELVVQGDDPIVKLLS